MDDGLAVLAPHSGAADDRPVLVLAAGWRSGSTLLQRLLVSSGQVLVWGEPYAHSQPVQHMTAMLPALDPSVLPEKWVIGRHPNDSPLADRFIANLYPPQDAMAEAHRAFYRALFAQPARSAGFPRWGIKEVRWGIEHARYFRTLFPDARIVLLVRNPYDSFASYSGEEWFWTWPTERIVSATQFGSKWADLAAGFGEGADAVDALTLTYEALVADPSEVDRLEAHLGFAVDRKVLDSNLGLSTRSPLEPSTIRELQRAVEPVASRFGYGPPLSHTPRADVP